MLHHQAGTVCFKLPCKCLDGDSLKLRS